MIKPSDPRNGAWIKARAVKPYIIYSGVEPPADTVPLDSCDIPDWSLDGSGIWSNFYADVKMDKNNFDKMWDMSPIKYVEGINVPILIIHGADDRRVPLGQSIELFSALKRLGKKVKFYQYAYNGHSFKQISHNDDMIAESLDFFENYNKDFDTKENTE